MFRVMQGGTLGARDFSSAVSGFCQVFIVTRAKSFSRGFGLRPKMCRPSANTENYRRTREKPLVPRVAMWETRWETLILSNILTFFCSNFVGLFDAGGQSHNTVYALHRSAWYLLYDREQVL